MQSHPANTRPHQLRSGGDQEIGTAISFTECSQMVGLIQKSVKTPQKHRLFVQLFFVQLSFEILLSDCWLSRVSVRTTCACAHTHTEASARCWRYWKSILNKAQGRQCVFKGYVCINVPSQGNCMFRLC